MGSTDYADLAVTVLFGVITLLALASLVLPFALRTSRLMWVVIVCGGALALVSSRVAITVDADGVVAGSAQPGIAMMILGLPRLRVSRRWWGGEAIPTVACVWQ